MWSPLVSLPSFERHLAVLEYERSNGWPKPFLGKRVSWITKWILNPDRVAAECDVLVWGSNPILGALVAAGLARQGKKVVFGFAEHRDLWDYPVAAKGVHDDLMEAAGLPKFSAKWLVDLARHGKGSLAMAWGFSPTHKNGELCMLRKDRDLGLGAPGETQAKISENLRAAFGKFPEVRELGRAEKKGGAELAIFAKEFVWVSDPKDGRASHGGDFSCEFQQEIGGEIRLGSGAWDSANPLTFASRSREDIQRALKLGEWGGSRHG